ncbi:MAG: tetratricopeptide repeat protein, partial [Terriglobales bacterium]
DTALNEFLGAAAIDPTSAIAQYHVGMAYYHLGRLPEASAAELRAIALDPQYKSAYIEFATIETKRTHFDKAKRALDFALQVWPDDASLKNMSAVVEKEQKMAPPIAVASVSPASTSTRHGGKEDRTNSISKKQSMLYGSKDVNGLLRDAETALARCDLQRAKKSLQFAATLEPNDPEIHIRLCSLLEAEGDTVGAVSEAQRALALDQTNPQWYLALGWAYSRQAKWQPSYEAFKEAYTMDNNLKDAIIGQTYALAKQGKFKLAKILLSVSDPAAHQTSWYHCASGLILEEKADLPGAYQEVAIAAKIAPNDYQVRYLLARVSYQLACKEKTKARWKQASLDARSLLAITPYDVEALINLGVALQKSSDNDGAIQALALATKLSPASASAHGAYAAALAAAGKNAEALVEAKTACKIDPDQKLAHTLIDELK